VLRRAPVTCCALATLSRASAVRFTVLAASQYETFFLLVAPTPCAARELGGKIIEIEAGTIPRAIPKSPTVAVRQISSGFRRDVAADSMKQRSKVTKLALALIGFTAPTVIGLSETANAALRHQQYGVDRPVPYWSGEVGPYHVVILPDGGVTGPIAPDANGG
jgi:hypothetical protein